VETAAAWRALALSLVGVFGVRAAGFLEVDDSAASVSSKRRGVFLEAGFLGAGVVDAFGFFVDDFSLVSELARFRDFFSSESWLIRARISRVESGFGSS